MAVPHTPTTPTYPAFDSESPSSSSSAFHPLVRSSTAPVSLASPRSHLAPEDAFYAAHSPPRPSGAFPSASGPSSAMNAAAAADLRSRRMRSAVGEPSRSRSRRRKRTWKKLLWVKQSYPDNYTDRATFLENLRRNPRLRPYDFWPLVADSTVIVQHVCSVIIFVVCFVGIFQERVSPVSVVGWGSAATFLGWLLWERWVAADEDGIDDGTGTPGGFGGGAMSGSGGSGGTTSLGRSGSSRRTGSIRRRAPPPLPRRDEGSSTASTSRVGSVTGSMSNVTAAGNGNGPSSERLTKHSHSASASSLHSQASSTGGSGTAASRTSAETYRPSLASPLSSTTGGSDGERENRTHQRLGTIKSAMLIYSTLLGLSPILKSLTRSTSSDSIWAMSFWLLAINIFFFDYSGGVGVKFPASLSTNAALMASTVLASRLPSTGQVFSLTLFSIEVFGLFPVFRRYARHQSWQYHVLLTVLLVLGAGAGVGMILGDSEGWPWRSGVVGMVVGVAIAAVAMGGCSWWLIGLQKYKNEIYGPWDPARPIIISRRHWDDG